MLKIDVSNSDPRNSWIVVVNFQQESLGMGFKKALP